MNTRPNFLVFITDQHRADHLGCAGAAQVHTPHIDALAAAGCRFERFHVATPLCQPNRASMMTGRLPSVHGVAMNGRELSFREWTFVEHLRRHGWHTGLVGKAHLQNQTTIPAAWPAPGEGREAEEALQAHPGCYGQENWKRWEDDPEHDVQLPYYGFAHVELAIGHGDDQHGHWRRWLRRQTPEADRLVGQARALPTPELALARIGQAWRTRLPEELHPTRWIAERSMAFLEAQAGSAERHPFFLQCSFPDPHHPYTPPGRYWNWLDPKDAELPPSFHAELIDPPPPIAALRQAAIEGRARKSGHGIFSCSEQEAREAVALNHGNLAFVDDAIGRVLQRLERLGLHEDTVVVFMSDHGDMLGDRGLMLKGGLHYHPLIRTPFIWRDTPGRPHAASTRMLAQTIDLAPTILERAGLRPAHGVQGVSLMHAIEGREDAMQHRLLLIEEEGQRRDFGLASRLRIRSLLTSTHRLTLYAGQSWGELIDLHEDPLELRNLWNDPASRPLRAELTEQLAQQMIASAESSPYPEWAA